MAGFDLTLRRAKSTQLIVTFRIIIIIMLPNQAIASTPSAPRPSGAKSTQLIVTFRIGCSQYLGR
jgi:hypothetical protein